VKTRKYGNKKAGLSKGDEETFMCIFQIPKREHIEGYFRSAKQNMDSTLVRMWDADTLRGRMFVQFIALCYYEFLSEEVRRMKVSLGKSSSDEFSQKAKQQINLEKN